MRKFAMIVELPTVDAMALVQLRAEEVPKQIVEMFGKISGHDVPDIAYGVEITFDMQTFFKCHNEPIYCEHHGLELVEKIGNDVNFLQELYDEINKKHLEELGL